MKALPSWTGWSRSRSAASPSLPPPPPATGATFRSTSSTRPATWISPPKWSAACACWMARWRCSTPWPACSRNRKRCGGRPTSTRVPRICFINKMDRVGADFYHSVDTIVDRLKCRPVPIQIPVGAEDQFKGIVDLVEMKASIWRDETLGAEYDVVEIPEDLVEKAKEYREKMIEAISRVRRCAVREVRRRPGAHQRRDPRRHPQGDHRAEDLPGDLRHGVQEQGRADHAGCGGGLPALAARRSAGGGPGRRRSGEDPDPQGVATTSRSRRWSSRS